MDVRIYYTVGIASCIFLFYVIIHLAIILGKTEVKKNEEDRTTKLFNV